jgi:hypothetical protein
VKAFFVVASLLVFWRHRTNIARLRRGSENRINVRAWWARRASPATRR